MVYSHKIASIGLGFLVTAGFSLAEPAARLVKIGESQPLFASRPPVVHVDLPPILPENVPGSIFTTPLVVEGLAADPSGIARDSDGNLSVGATQVMQWANFRLQIYDKHGNQIGGPIPGTQLFATATNGCETAVSADGLVKYDTMASKWVIFLRTGLNIECIAISKTSDATGAYNLFSFAYTDANNPTTTQMDYPKLGIWPDGYYLTFDMLDTNNNYNWEYAAVCALDRKSLIAGSAGATPVCFRPSAVPVTNTAYHLMPADLDGPRTPPAGSPNYQVMFAQLQGQTVYHLYEYQFHVNFTTPSQSTFTGPLQMDINAFTTFVPACGAGTHNCILQPPPATGQNALDSVGGYLMYRLAYRNFAGHESLVVTQAANKGAATQVGVRWYEFRTPLTKPQIFQSGFWIPDAKNNRWMSSAAMDHLGNIAIGYSIASVSTFPSIGLVGRLVSDPAGKLETELKVFSGHFDEIGPKGKGRWGAYSSMAIDPVDDCTFWYSNQYQPSQGYYNWGTKLISFQITGCAAAK